MYFRIMHIWQRISNLSIFINFAHVDVKTLVNIYIHTYDMYIVIEFVCKVRMNHSPMYILVF